MTVAASSSRACIDFTDLVVDDDIALEGTQSFTIVIGTSTAMVNIIDDDSQFTHTHTCTHTHTRPTLCIPHTNLSHSSLTYSVMMNTHTHHLPIVPEPVFEMGVYSVPEGDPTSVPLCVDLGVTLAQPATYTITTQQKAPPQAQGEIEKWPLYLDSCSTMMRCIAGICCRC